MIIEAYGKTFELLNDEKFKRATEGTLARNGQLAGGVGTDSPGETVIAEYDRLGGGIRLNGDRVKRGCFYDFPKRKPVEKPEILLEFNINGKIVSVSADEPLPALVRAAKEAEQGVAPAAGTDEEEGEKPKRTRTIMNGTGRRTAKSDNE